MDNTHILDIHHIKKTLDTSEINYTVLQMHINKMQTDAMILIYFCSNNKQKLKTKLSIQLLDKTWDTYERFTRLLKQAIADSMKILNYNQSIKLYYNDIILVHDTLCYLLEKPLSIDDKIFRFEEYHNQIVKSDIDQIVKLASKIYELSSNNISKLKSTYEEIIDVTNKLKETYY